MEANTLGFSLSFRLKLLLFTVLLTVLTVSFVSSISMEPMTDDSSRVRVAEIEEASNNNDAPPSFENAPDIPFLPHRAPAVFFAHVEAAFNTTSDVSAPSSLHARPLTRAPPTV